MILILSLIVIAGYQIFDSLPSLLLWKRNCESMICISLGNSWLLLDLFGFSWKDIALLFICWLLIIVVFLILRIISPWEKTITFPTSRFLLLIFIYSRWCLLLKKEVSTLSCCDFFRFFSHQFVLNILDVWIVGHSSEWRLSARWGDTFYFSFGSFLFLVVVLIFV